MEHKNINEKFLGKIIEILATNPKEYMVKFKVWNNNEIDELLFFQDSNEFTLHSDEYSLTITGDSMSTDNKLDKCMEVYHSYEYSDNLNPTLRRQWKTAEIADNITFRIISSNTLNIYDELDFDE